MNMRHIKSLAEKEAAFRGLSFEWRVGGSHHLMTLHRNGERRQIAISGSPRSGDNQIDWIRQDIRRISRELR